MRPFSLLSLRIAAFAIALACSSGANATFHTFKIEQIFSNADGTVQFVVMHEALNADGQEFWANHTFQASAGGVTRTFMFPNNLPDDSTRGRRVLIATQGFAALGILTPDYVIPNGFLPTGSGTLNFAGVDVVNYGALPTDGVTAITRNGSQIPNVATNFDGHTASVTPPPAVLGNFQGLWWNAPANSESGWGINLNHQGNLIFATWFTYGLDGKPIWLVASANSTLGAPNTFTGTLYTGTGPPFNAFDPAKVVAIPAGTVTLTFTGIDTATFAYTVNGISQSKQITREVFAAPVPTCAFSAQPNHALATNYQDLWWNAPANSEPGWGVNLTHQGDTIFLTWFTFGLDGNVLWLVVAANRTAPNVYSGTLVQPLAGPPFNAVPFDPALVNGVPVGTVTLTFTDGNNATFAYSVNGVEQTKSITREILTAPGTGTVCQ
jgi:hypothetical protein